MRKICFLIALAACAALALAAKPEKRYGEVAWIPPCPNGTKLDGDGDCDGDHYGYWIRLKALLITTVVILSVLSGLLLVWALLATIHFINTTRQPRAAYTKL
jgi:hypothetical protein